MKKVFIVLSLIFICGIISGDIISSNLKKESLIIGTDVFYNYANSKFEFKDLFWSILFQRVEELIFLIILSLTALRKRMGFIFLCIYSYISGFFYMASIISYGFWGLVIAFLVSLTIFVFYGGILVLLFQKRNNSYSFHYKKKVAKDLATYLLIFLFLLTGCILESILGVHVIPWIIRLSLV